MIKIISPRQASAPNQASSPSYEQLLNCESFFTGQFPINVFTCYFESFLHITIQIFLIAKNCPHQNISDLGISKAGEVKEEEELQTMLKWAKTFFDAILDCKIFTYLKNKK